MSEPKATAKSLRPFRFTKKNLYDLMPAIYRARDAELGKPLEALMGVISEQVRVIEDNIDELYQDWFVETCDPWVVPYIGDLLQARLLNENVTGAIPERSYVANTISYRRRKGTVSMLEELAADVTGWPAKVVEEFELLEWTQYINHLRPTCFRTPDIRQENTLELFNTPFDSIALTVDVRHINNGRGYYNIPDIGIFLYRLTAYPVNDAPAFDVSAGSGRFKFNVLGLDEPLFNNPIPKTDEFQLAQEINVPLPIRRTALFDDAGLYYDSGGIEKSIRITADDVVVSSGNVTAYDLSGWWRPPTGSGQAVIDPLLGRISFANGWNPKEVHVSYHYGFSDEVGGGFYTRPDPDASLVTVLVGASPQAGQVYQIKTGGPKGQFQFDTISSALSTWVTNGQPSAIFEIQDSEVYLESPIVLTLPAGVSVEIRAAQNQRPLLQMPIVVTAATAAPDSPRASLFVNGLLLDGGSASSPQVLVEPGDLGALTLRHSTLVPGPSMSLSLSGASDGLTTNDNLVVTVDHSITGAISIDPAVSQAQIQIEDSIIDGQSGTVAEGSFVLTTALGSNHSVGEAVVVTTKTTTSAAAASGQSVVPVGSTTGFSVGGFVLIGDGASDHEAGVVASIQAGVSLTLGSDLVNNHAAGEQVTATLETTVVSLASKGAEGISVSTTAAFAAGMVLTINPGGSDSESVTIAFVESGAAGVALNCYQLTILESTVFGGTRTFMVNLASNTIFTQSIISTRRQVGCVRYCYLPAGSRVPRPYKCQPAYPPGSSIAEQTALALSVEPIFTSMSYGAPGYAQLATDGPTAIFRGADNGAEMGVFNELLQPLRIDNLNATLDQYLRFGLEAGIIPVT